jgi:hypothetical protein
MILLEAPDVSSTRNACWLSVFYLGLREALVFFLGILQFGLPVIV